MIFLSSAVIIRFLRSFFDAHANYQLAILGSDISNCLALGMVKKSLNYSVLCNKNFKMGELANLIQVDCFRMTLFPKNLSNVIFIIYTLIFSITFMAFLVGVSFLTGVAIIIVISIVNMLISRIGSKYQINLSNETDNRMKETNEVFNNIKFIKVNAWEEYFYDKLQLRRDQ
jgi:hypothetical protein